MICLEDLVFPNQIYRKFQELWDFTDIQKELEKIERDSDHKGFGIFRLFLALLLQFLTKSEFWKKSNKVAITKASTIDSKGIKYVIPSQGAVYADKGYCDKNAKK